MSAGGASPLSTQELLALDTFVPPLRALGRVGLVGGSFNPPHIGHVLMALSVYATEELDHLWVLPTADHALGKSLAPFADRLRMCHLAFRHFAGGVAVVDLENRLPKPSYTVNLLRALHALRPGIKPVWIVGADIVHELPLWKEPEEVQRLARFVVVPREGYENGGFAVRLQVPLPLLSSTDVRDRIMRGASVEGLLDREVASYIERRGLYRSGVEGPG